MPNWKKVITSGSDATLNSLTVTSGVTGSLFGTSSYAITASYAENGGVTQIIAGTNVTISPLNGLGAVTINATATGGGSSVGANVTASFTNSTTWNFNHALGNRNALIQVYDFAYNQIIPQTINLVDDNNATITFPTSETGFAIASLGGTPATASYISPTFISASAAAAGFGSGGGSSISASYASTASYVNILNQNVTLNGSASISYLTVPTIYGATSNGITLNSLLSSSIKLQFNTTTSLELKGYASGSNVTTFRYTNPVRLAQSSSISSMIIDLGSTEFNSSQKPTIQKEIEILGPTYTLSGGSWPPPDGDEHYYSLYINAPNAPYAAYTLGLSGSLRIEGDGDLDIGNGLNGSYIGYSGAQLGFFGATPTTQPAAVTSAQELANAIAKLGLVATSSLSNDIQPNDIFSYQFLLMGA